MNINAALGPTNTGKTFYAIERMTSYQSGIIGLPLRLLTKEVFDKISKKVGPSRTAMITGEERIIPQNPKYWICTVESMPTNIPVDFVAIDEIQLLNDPERGYAFTEKILQMRGMHETLLMGSDTVILVDEVQLSESKTHTKNKVYQQVKIFKTVIFWI